jgi:arsenite methyltransferase
MRQSSPGTIYEHFGVTETANEGIRPGGLKLTERAMEFCRFAPQLTILDIGCGNGATVHYLQTIHNLWAIGIDTSSVLVGEARKRQASPLLMGTADRLPFGDSVFDGIFLECTLSLIKDSRNALAECRRVLRAGGKLVINDVYVRNPAGLAGLRKLPPTSCLRGAKVQSELKEEVRISGFEIELWEDHSYLLKDFAVKIVWTMGSMKAFWGLAGNQAKESGALEEAVRHARPGYHLLIGSKQDM